MTHVPYTYHRIQPSRYTFVSIGKKRIEKVVDFIPLKTKYFLNLGFGDLLPDGSIDFNVNSNNGDIIKVLATVVDILRDFTEGYPAAVIFFTGSSFERTRLYARIVKTYYVIFSQEFAIYGLIGNDEDNKAIPFEPMSNLEYFAFIVKRII